MWEKLSSDQKVKYKEYCDNKFGTTIMFCETGEPMYMDNEGYLIDTSIIIELLFSVSNN